jgi:hypothetical protein
MSSGSKVPALSLDEQRFIAERDFRSRELLLREREVAAKEAELKRSKWSNPLIIGLLAAGIGLLGNLVVTSLSDYHSANLERERDEAARISTALSTRWDRKQACNNMIMLLGLKLLHDKDGTISNCAIRLQLGGLNSPEDRVASGSSEFDQTTGKANSTPAPSSQPQVSTANQLEAATEATGHLSAAALNALNLVRKKYFDPKQTPAPNAFGYLRWWLGRDWVRTNRRARQKESNRILCGVCWAF